MISDFIMNLSLLMSFTFVWHQLFKHNRLTMDSPLLVKCADGVLAGILGIILMQYSILVNDITFLDLRHIPVILVALYGGIVPSLLAAIVISIGRFEIAFNISSITSLVMMLGIGIGAGLISHYIKLSFWKKWTVLLVFSQTIFTVALYYVVESFSNVLEYAFYHCFISIAGGYLTLYFVVYIRRNSEMYMKYKQDSQKDFLTGLNNARGFDLHFNRMIERMREHNEICSFCMIDIDHFKKINDTYGHKAGDEVLKQLADILRQSTRSYDLVSRNGGEEFSILIPDCHKYQARDLAERLRMKVENHSFTLSNQKVVRITISIGITDAKEMATGSQQMIGRADDALYAAKHSGRNVVKVV